jgi:hypothetical protein
MGSMTEYRHSALVGAVDEARIKASIQSQQWDEDEQGFEITPPSEFCAGSQPEQTSDSFSRPFDFQ